MSIWQDHSVDTRIREILASVPESGHHFGRSFLSAYQIAIAFNQRYAHTAGLIAKPVGGTHTGRYDSLAQYFANQLSQRIRNGELRDIEGRYLNGRFLESLRYNNGEETVSSSLRQANMSIFRLAPTLTEP